MERTATFQNSITELVIKSPINVILVTDTSSLVSVYGSKKEVNRIRIKERNGKLTLRKSFFSAFKASPFIVVSAPSLRKLHVNENSVVESSGMLHLPELEVVVNSDATVRLRLEGNSVAAALKGNGSVKIEGNYQQTAICQAQYGWCKVRYLRATEALVLDPH